MDLTHLGLNVSKFTKFMFLEIFCMFLFYKGFYEGSKISDPKIENIK